MEPEEGWLLQLNAKGELVPFEAAPGPSGGALNRDDAQNAPNVPKARADLEDIEEEDEDEDEQPSDGAADNASVVSVTKVVASRSTCFSPLLFSKPVLIRVFLFIRSQEGGPGQAEAKGCSHEGRPPEGPRA